jgi:hypothetical protein
MRGTVTGTLEEMREMMNFITRNNIKREVGKVVPMTEAHDTIRDMIEVRTQGEPCSRGNGSQVRTQVSDLDRTRGRWHGPLSTHRRATGRFPRRAPLQPLGWLPRRATPSRSGTGQHARPGQSLRDAKAAQWTTIKHTQHLSLPDSLAGGQNNSNRTVPGPPVARMAR